MDKVPKGQNSSAALGTAVHRENERYLKEGWIDASTTAGDIALAGLHMLPPPGYPYMAVEREFTTEISGIVWRGLKDIEIEAPGEIPIIVDHKTTKDFRWALTPESLARDVQACVYAAETFVRRPDAPEVELRWNYYRTTGARKIHPVHIRVSRETISEGLAKGHNAATKILRVLNSGITSALQLPPNATECEAYGGCAYQDRCNLSPHEKVKSIMAQMDLNSFLGSLQNPNAQPQPAPAQPPPPQPQAQPAPWDAPQAPPPQPQPQAPANYPQAWGGPPPQAPPAPTPPPQPAPPTSPQYIAAAPTPNQWEAPAQPQPPPQPPAPPAGPPQGWAPPPNVQPQPEPQGRVRRTKEQIAREDGFDLFVDCIPVKGTDTPEDLSTRLSRVVALASAALGTHPMAHPQGIGCFLHMLAKDLDENVQIKSAMLTTKQPEAAIALNTLMAKARRVYRAYNPA